MLEIFNKKKYIEINEETIECNKSFSKIKNICFYSSSSNYLPLPTKIHEYLIDYFFNLSLKNIIHFFYENDFKGMSAILKNKQKKI